MNFRYATSQTMNVILFKNFCNVNVTMNPGIPSLNSMALAAGNCAENTHSMGADFQVGLHLYEDLFRKRASRNESPQKIGALNRILIDVISGDDVDFLRLIH